MGQKGINILLDSNCLKYNGKYYSISFEDCAWDHESEEYAAWSGGRRFFYDFNVFGFFSINTNRQYGGNVYRRPEILCDLDNLLKTRMYQILIYFGVIMYIVFVNSSEIEDKMYMKRQDGFSIISLNYIMTWVSEKSVLIHEKQFTRRRCKLELLRLRHSVL